MSIENVMKMIKDNDVKFLSLRFTDTRGRVQNLGVPISQFSEEMFDEDVYFDGSSIEGWQPINQSDMAMKMDPHACVMDPFAQEPTLIVRCSIFNPTTKEWYHKDPRSIAKKAEEFLQAQALRILPTLVRNQNFLSLTEFVGVIEWRAASTKSVLTKEIGIVAKISMMVLI